MSMIGTEQRLLLRQAAHWHAVLCSEDASTADRAAWQAWHDQHADHQWAWRQVEHLRQRLQDTPGPLAARALQAAGDRAGVSRRVALKGLALCLAGGGALALGSRTQTWQQWAADHRTGIGEQRDVMLADGSRLQLNTDTAVDVRYDGNRRLLLLHHGEILVTTASDAQRRPFLVQVPEGSVQALGTRFLVRRDTPGKALAMVLESAVSIQPDAAQATPLLLQAGQQAWFQQNGAGPVTAADDASAAWHDGMLVVSDWRLDAFLAELGRYRPGWLDCDPAVAGLRVSGAFPVRDTDRALDALAGSFPIRIRTRTRYWVRLESVGA